ncbi:MAG: peptide chain release factor-like protein [Hyphomicrobium sp.]|uniref:peptide chain release factor-like protein n=1 Tax=Hyphomicrobium sp. TaxID=82 RepID=UPI0035615BA0
MIPDEHLRVELIYRVTGTTTPPGGQHAGSPVADIRVTHLPSGIFAQCGVSRSQHKNKMIAVEMIEAALTCKWSNEI